MGKKEDKYPSRVEGIGQILQRDEPVIHGSGKGPLGSEQLKKYEEDGYLFMESFFDSDAVKTLYAETEHLRTFEKVRQSELAINEPTSGKTRSIFAVHTVSELYEQLARDKRILDIVQQLLGSELYLHQTCLNMKPGFKGKEFYWHSDFETWHTEDGMPEMRAVSCSIALTDNYQFSGPVMVIPGSHKYFCQCSGLTPESHYEQSLKHQDYGVPSEEQLEWLTQQRDIDVPVGPAGSVVFYDSNLMHGSSSNITPYPRRHVFLVYNSMENQVGEPYASSHERPWYLCNREPEALKPVDFSESLKKHATQTA